MIFSSRLLFLLRLLVLSCFVAGSAGASTNNFISPANGSTLGGTTQIFTWNDVGAQIYAVAIGSVPGANDVGTYPASGTPSTTTTVSGLPTDGRTVYARLYWLSAGTWFFSDHTYSAWSPTAALISSPANGSTLGGTTTTFVWNDVSATLYGVAVGNTRGGNDIGTYPAAGTTATTTTARGLPMDGRTLYVRLYSQVASGWYWSDYAYKAWTVASATLSTPPNGTTLNGPTQTFTWNDVGADLYALSVGSSLGNYDIGTFPAAGTTSTTTTVSGLPQGSKTIYVRLWSQFSSGWYYSDYTFTVY